MKDKLSESIVLDGAAARGDADQEPEAFARLVWKPPFRKLPEPDGCTCDAATCTVGKPMCGLQAMPMAR